MHADLALIVTAATMMSCAVYLILERSLTRVLVGLILLGNGVNLLLMTSGGRAGAPPLLRQHDPATITDPLPQALVLTAIVIGLGTTSFLLAMAYRSWQLNQHDDVQDDVEDRQIIERALRDETPGDYDLDDEDEEVYEEEHS